MKKNLLYLFLGVVIVIFAACENAEYQPYDNSLYIAEAYGGNQKNVVVNEDGGSVEFIVRTAQPIERALTVNIKADNDALDRYNLKNNTHYKMLPADCYQLSNTEVNIAGGGMMSNIIRVTIAPKALDLLSSADKYALAVTIISASESGLHIMDNLKTCVFICTKSE